jgi:hypothetical protein
MREFPELLTSLAVAYHARLSSGDLNRRLAHHLAHAAPEAWLAQELAFLVNAEGASFGLAGWSALLEHAKVDVTLLLPGDDLAAERLHLEFNLVPPTHWRNWHEVYRDLGCYPQSVPKQGKPAADFALCFLVETVSTSTVKQRSDTLNLYRDRIERVPDKPSSFAPIPGLPPLWLAYTTPTIRAEWPHAVRDRWPQGFDTFVRILWVSADKQLKAADAFAEQGAASNG